MVKAVIQRVSSASVRVAGETTGSIQQGILVLLGVAEGDSHDDALLLARRCASLRIFDDENRLMNLSLEEVCGSILVISQFTLLANCRKGRRPSFSRAAKPADAEPMVEFFVATLRQMGFQVETGIFGARMEVELVNDGPVTLVLDTDELRKSRRGNSPSTH